MSGKRAGKTVFSQYSKCQLFYANELPNETYDMEVNKKVAMNREILSLSMLLCAAFLLDKSHFKEHLHCDF